MLLKRKTLDGIAAGVVTLAFRRWKRPTVKAGGQLRTVVGVLAIDEVSEVRWADVSDEDARRAGHVDRAELGDALRGREGRLYRISVRLSGPDPRRALRARAKLGAEELHELEARLERLDRASPRGPWTRTILTMIAERPAVRAPDLAASMGWETVVFKRNVRKLKELGLTESLEVGYRLAPRGRALTKRW